LIIYLFDSSKGNPKDGIHLSRRPDVLLTSTGAQGLHKFGLLVCKVREYMRRLSSKINSSRYLWVKVMQLYLR
jgi:hypothetical protein